MQQWSYTFDGLGNLRNRKDELHRLRAISGSGSQAFDEHFDYDALNRLKEVRQGGSVSMALTYANNGNILTKSDVQGGATYTYGSRPSQCNRTPGPRAVSQIGTQSYCYDAMGNQTHQYNNGSLVRQIDYNAIGKASRIRSHSIDTGSGRSVGETRFTFDGSRNQVRRHSTEQGKTSTIIQQGGTELIIEGSERRFRRNLGNAIVERSGDSITTRYVYTDHLGSVDVITNAIGQLIEKLSFDAFGKRRAVFNQSGQSIALNLTTLLAITHQGFTGHQQVDHAGIVQMGGRIYDAHIGRFLQADPFVQSPSNSQNFNRYSYVLNNPLSYTDPSGYLFKSIKKHWRTIAAIAIAVYMPHLAIMQGLNAATVGAITGFVAGAVSTGTLKGALVGAFTGGMFGHLHSMNAGFGKVMAHGAVGGMGSVLQGGKFGHGFAAAGFTQAASWAGGDNLFVEGATEIGDRTHNAVVAAMIGGTASSMAGGKFSNGAVTGAFSRLLNDDYSVRQLTKAQQEIQKMRIEGATENDFMQAGITLGHLSHDEFIDIFPEFSGNDEMQSTVRRYGLYAAFRNDMGIDSSVNSGVGYVKDGASMMQPVRGVLKWLHRGLNFAIGINNMNHIPQFRPEVIIRRYGEKHFGF
ncbi:RHS repeat-associated core domain-containing protein [Alkalimonas delamerensis]|uniref:RHS repeat-associated core domain-containing protein n=1 Tax=Alkalimonas delamerensis TaxID=265981 RepID=A0ABT9GQN0_9GAMM|nr:RHS repeat-associated core domain-containing protein [Alkalimonas delamerensis]MDP4529278.1 RHS repeat-associated core domain-containing protein [Alkalimonas delamerensis]